MKKETEMTTFLKKHGEAMAKEIADNLLLQRAREITEVISILKTEGNIDNFTRKDIITLLKRIQDKENR